MLTRVVGPGEISCRHGVADADDIFAVVTDEAVIESVEGKQAIGSELGSYSDASKYFVADLRQSQTK